MEQERSTPSPTPSQTPSETPSEMQRKKAKMPSYSKNRNMITGNVENIKCPVCAEGSIVFEKKNSIEECPCCNPRARAMFGVASILTQHGGWTTKECVNAYYRKEVKKMVYDIVKRLTEKEKEINPNISNKALKEFTRKETLKITETFLSKGKYKLLK